VSRYLESLSCHVWLTNSATGISLNKPVKAHVVGLNTKSLKRFTLKVAFLNF